MTNIFWFHEDPRIAARYHADKHVPKLAIEAAQAVATALRRNGYDGSDTYEEYPSPGAQRTPQDWCTASRAHADLAIDYGIAVIAERNRRWPDRNAHKTMRALRRQRELLDHEDVEWPATEPAAVPPTFGLDDSYDDLNYVSAYRAYAVAEKGYADEANFTATQRPWWASESE